MSDERIGWRKSLPFIGVHLLALLAFVVPFQWSYVLLAVGLYYARMLVLTIGYHRYFSHRSFQTSRVFQFVLAFAAETSAQKGVLWWAAHHRHHHKFSDQPEDIHSPAQKGFWWSHVGWVLCPKYDATRWEQIKDFSRFPELRFIDRHWWLPPLLGAVVLFTVGGLPVLVWGGFVSTVVLFHGTFTINSLSHVFGRRRYLTTDTSRNNWLLALITCGEGWHNNHHFHQNTANQGWFWWEVDFSYLLLRGLEQLGLVWKLKKPEAQTRFAHLKYTDAQRAQLDPRRGMPVRAPQPAP
ncbi:MAG: fatty acid desaturase [Archangiaceae bacterium]|nr:fatty acid desaturase [Archangiaceae bacterium]